MATKRQKSDQDLSVVEDSPESALGGEEGDVISYRDLRGNLKAVLSGEKPYLVRSHSHLRAIIIPLRPQVSQYYNIEGAGREAVRSAKAQFVKMLEKIREICPS